MTTFDLDLQTVEDRMEDPTDGEAGDEDEGGDAGVVLGVLDGTTDAEEWFGAVEDGDVLVLAVEGDVNERASGFARDVAEAGGDLVHFREHLVVTPPGVEVDTERL